MKTGDGIKVTTFVEVDPEDAFAVFTEETDLWWRRGPRYRFGRGDARGTLRFERPGPGALLVESFDGGEAFVIGQVLVWEPSARLAFEWRGRNFADGEGTRVDIAFEGVNGGTRVTLEHTGWSAIRPDHPARHGLTGGAFTAMIGMWWGELATSLRSHVTGKWPTR